MNSGEIQLIFWCQNFITVYSTEFRNPTSPTCNQPGPIISKPSVDPKHISAEDMQSFKNPDNLNGRQFVFSPDTEESGMYEVVGFYKGKYGEVQYDIIFEDIHDPIQIDAKEMVEMLKGSLKL